MWVEHLLGAPLRVLIIIGVAVLLTLVLRLVVRRAIRRLSRLPNAPGLDRAHVAIGGPSNRMQQRLRTLQSVLNSVITATIGVIAVIMVLAEVGVQVAPLLASAGVLGVALAFGAQSLVQDVISGLFMLVEDQYGVGDRVELAGGGSFATGTVERVALRITTVRDDDGRLWHVRNGEITRVANESQGWSRAIAEIRVVAETDVARAREALEETTAQIASDAAFAGAVLSEPEVLVDDVSASAIVLRWSVRTAAGAQWRVASALRRQAPAALAEHGVTLAQ